MHRRSSGKNQRRSGSKTSVMPMALRAGLSSISEADVKLGDGKVDDEVLVFRAVTAIAEQKVQGLFVGKELLGRNPFVGEQKPHGAAALQAFGDGGEAVTPIISVCAALIHEIAGHIACWRYRMYRGLC
jgi:hypothetical protein